jgi:signal transduction histidine kinase
MKFRYRLDKYDRDWHEAGTRRQAFYTDLPPGKYSFRVIAGNSDGVWNESAAKLDFSITPAYYQTNWFRGLCLIAFLGLVWAAHRWRVRQLQKQFEITLDARVSERIRVARDLHDTLLQSFQALLPLFQVGVIKLPEGAVESRKILESALDRASEAIGEGRDAIKGLRMSTIEKNDLAMAIRTCGEELAAADKGQNSVSFELIVEGAPRELHPILRDEIYRLATEALRNSFRHACAKNVEVEIRYDEKYFRLRVRDDGKGIPSGILSRDGREGHYGLPGMRERAALVGGKLTIWTELDSGTEIELVIPGAKVYVTSTRRFWPFGARSATETRETERIEREW